MKTKIIILGMTCDCCIDHVKTQLHELGFTIESVTLGIAIIKESLDPAQMTVLVESFKTDKRHKLEIDEKATLDGQIKCALREALRLTLLQEKIILSEFLAKKLEHSYIYLFRIFKEKNGMTVIHYFIMMKIEKVVELLRTDSLDEITYLLQYSTKAQLSRQFRQIKGITIKNFKKTHE